MNLETAGRRPMSGPKHAGGDEDGGISGGVERTPRHRVPAPKGKGAVMIVLAVAVLIALIWDFSGRGPASRATREAVERDREERKKNAKRPLVAPEDPDLPPTSLPGVRPPAPGHTPNTRVTPKKPATIEVRMGQATVTMPAAAALAFWVKAPEAEREALRLQILDALLEPARGGGTAARDAFDAAAWLVEGAREKATEAILRLTNATTAALEDDAAAAGAILFLSRLPDGVDRRTAVSLDGVISDPSRPLRVRIAAARLRPKEGRPQRVSDLIEDPLVHPALRDALKE